MIFKDLYRINCGWYRYNVLDVLLIENSKKPEHISLNCSQVMAEYANFIVLAFHGDFVALTDKK